MRSRYHAASCSDLASSVASPYASPPGSWLLPEAALLGEAQAEVDSEAVDGDLERIHPTADANRADLPACLSLAVGCAGAAAGAEP